MTKLERIQEMEQQLQALKAEVEAESKAEKWQPKSGEWYINEYGDVFNSGANEDYSTFGMIYPTEEQAEKARDAMRSHNRLLAWLAENDDGFVANWSDFKQHKHSVFLDYNRSKYCTVYNTAYKHVGAVYMSKENANKLCKLLNEGVVEL